MRIRLRQVAFVATDLEPVEIDIIKELGVERCYRDPGVAVFGLKNVLFPIGDKLLEVVSPIRQHTTAGRLLDKRGGNGGYVVMLQVDDLDAMKLRFDANSIRVIYTATAPGITGMHLHPKDVGGAILSVDRTDAWDDWAWAGPNWRDHLATNVVTDITGVAMQSDDPARMATKWATVLGRQVTEHSDERHIQLNEGVLRFVPLGDDRGDGLCTLDVRAADAMTRTATLCGVTINFVA